MPLITQADIEARIGALTAEQVPRVEALIADAEATLLVYADRFRPGVDDDTVVVRAVGKSIRLAGGVNSVDSVTAITDSGEYLVADRDWFFDGIDRVELTATLGYVGVSTYRVVYSHGSTVTPAAIVSVLCGMVSRVLTSPSMTEGLTQETIGQYGYQMQQGAGTSGTSVRMSRSDKDLLRRFHTSSQTLKTSVR